MKMTVSIVKDVLVLKIAGELMGGDESKVFHDRIYDAIRDGHTKIVADMTEVKWMNSSGLGMLMAGLTTLRSSDGDLKLACLSDRVRRPIEITKLDQVLKGYATVNEAVASLKEEA